MSMRAREVKALSGWMAVLTTLSLVACGSSADPGADDPLGLPGDAADPTRLGADGGAEGGTPVVPRGARIEHVVVIMQENHTFDTYFGRWCKAAPGSNPSCTKGQECCEAAPDREPSGGAPIELTDEANAAYDPDHSQPCEVAEMNGGKMDRFVKGASCSNAKNFAISPAAVVAPYHDYAAKYAIGDRYFQSIIGQTSANDMYFAVAKKVFTDNAFIPNAIGQGCSNPLTPKMRNTSESTIADILINHGERVRFYAEGYDVMRSSGSCPPHPSDCRGANPVFASYPCAYDPSDIPFNYYQQFTDNPAFLMDWSQFEKDLGAGDLAEVSYIKPIGYHTEHPGYGTSISVGVAWVEAAISKILASPYAKNTLVLLTWDEGGGYYDHVSPPNTPSPIDQERVGTRVPIFAIGRFAKKNYVSHVVMEHSSIVKFLEWNFIGKTGQLQTRDTLANNIGSLIDPAETLVPVPEQ
jgi:phospholipase C